MTDARRETWNQRHAAAQESGTIAAVRRHNRHLIPHRGQALLVAERRAS